MLDVRARLSRCPPRAGRPVAGGRYGPSRFEWTRRNGRMQTSSSGRRRREGHDRCPRTVAGASTSSAVTSRSSACTWRRCRRTATSGRNGRCRARFRRRNADRHRRRLAQCRRFQSHRSRRRSALRSTHNMRIVDECVNCTFSGLRIHDFAMAQVDISSASPSRAAGTSRSGNSIFRSCSVFAIFAKPGDESSGANREQRSRIHVIRRVERHQVHRRWRRHMFEHRDPLQPHLGQRLRQLRVVRSRSWAMSSARNQSGCGPAWDYNVFVRATPCGQHAMRVTNARFVDAAKGIFRLGADHRPSTAARRACTRDGTRTGDEDRSGTARTPARTRCRCLEGARRSEAARYREVRDQCELDEARQDVVPREHGLRVRAPQVPMTPPAGSGAR